MKVEQRIGRIDRIGQLHPRIRIYNLAYQDTVEADVYFKVGQRINLFQGILGKLQPILSRLPKKLEEYALGAAADKEEARQKLVSELEDLEREANEPGFDIDASGIDGEDNPKLPAPAVALSDLDRLCRQRIYFPRVLRCGLFDARSYGILLPGMKNELRVTTSGEVFSYCSDSQLLFSPGNYLFDEIANLAARQSEDQSRFCVCWLAKETDAAQFVCATHSGIREVSTFSELESAIAQVGSPVELPEEFEVVERIA